jgi:uncharacterized protein (TIGR03083 family)
VVAVGEIQPLVRPEALEIAEHEYARYLDQLRSLSAEDWPRETECIPWTVRDMAVHVLGQAEAIGSVREMVHQQRGARKASGDRQDAVNALQIRERFGFGDSEVLQRLPVSAAASIRFRRRLPELVRRIRFPVQPGRGARERWSFANLFDVIYTRDIWMHRIDTARSVGIDLTLTPDHDGRIVADVVADWSRRHGAAFELDLAGPAGGSYRSGVDGEQLAMDAIEFCRGLSGRGGEQAGLLATFVPF